MILSISKRMANNHLETNKPNYSRERDRGRRFSVNYVASSQNKFLEHLARDEYEEAVGVLERLPTGQNRIADAERLIVIAEGYRMLYHAISDSLVDDTDDNGGEELSELDERFRRTSL